LRGAKYGLVCGYYTADTPLSHAMPKVVCTPSKGSPDMLLRRTTLMRLFAVPACLAWGLAELWALQRARWEQRRFGH